MRISILKSIALSTLLLTAGLAEAKVLSKYRSYVVSKNKAGEHVNFLIGMTNSFRHLTGTSLRCSSSMSAKLNEYILDHKGNRVLRNYDYNSDYSHDVTWSGEPSINNDFYVNFSHYNPQYDVTLSERCTYTYPDVCERAVYDQNGNRTGTTVERCTRSKTLNMSWACSINDFPRQINERAHYRCQPKQRIRSYEMYPGLSSYAISAMRDKEIHVSIEKTGEEVKTKSYGNCYGKDDSEKRVINFMQGVDGHFGENDFVFKIRINNEGEFIRESTDGLVSFDLDYCPEEGVDKLQIEVQAVEEDWITADDDYVPQNSVTVSLDKKGNKEGAIRLKRDTWFGEFFGDSEGQVRVRLIK